MKTIKIHIGGRMRICPDEIMLLEANANYTNLYMLDGKKITVATTLKKLEKRFVVCQNFFRTHKSHLINLDYLSDYQVDRNMIVMQNDKTILISRRKKNAFRSKLEI